MSTDLNSAHSQSDNIVYDGLSVHLTAAPLGKRTLAYLIDLGVIYAITIPLFIVFGFFGAIVFGFWKTENEGTSKSAGFAPILLILLALVILLGLAALYHGYFVYYEYKKGATPGKQIFGLRVVSSDGTRMRLGQCVLRDLMRYVDCIMVLPGLLSVLLSKNSQRMGDLMAGTRVVHSNVKENCEMFLYVKHDHYHYLYDLLEPSVVPIQFCRKYLERAYNAYVSPTRAPFSRAEVHFWEPQLLEFLPQARNHGLDQTTTMLFFAELCYQTLHTNHSKETSNGSAL